MRRRLQPLLAEMYGDGYTSHLNALAVESDQLRELVRNEILVPALRAVSVSPLAVWFDCTPHFDRPLIFWKQMFEIICHKLFGNVSAFF